MIFPRVQHIQQQHLIRIDPLKNIPSSILRRHSLWSLCLPMTSGIEAILITTSGSQAEKTCNRKRLRFGTMKRKDEELTTEYYETPPHDRNITWNYILRQNNTCCTIAMEPYILAVCKIIQPIHHEYTGLILGLRPANERRRYKVTPPLIGWAQT